MKKTILVTGGAGFIGANLVPMLQEQKYNVRVLDNLSRGSKEYLPDGTDIYVGDIRNSEDLTEAMKGVDALVHLAAYGSVVESVEAPEENFDINAFGTFNTLNQANKSGIRQVVFASTGGALIGNATPPVNEDSVPRPISPYGASKLCGEAYCSAFASSYKMNITALRFANVIGPVSEHKKGAVTAFIKAIDNDNPITIYGDGKATRDFLYVGDLCRGIISALNANLKGFNPIHLASGSEVSVKELAEEVKQAANVPNHEVIYFEKRVGEVERNFADYDKASELLNFEPSVSLGDAIKITIKSFKK